MESLLLVAKTVARFSGAKYIFMGASFGVYFMFKTNFSGHNKIWQCPPVAMDLGRGTKKVKG